MAFNLLIPELENRPKNTKDAVISILSIEWPLSLKKIFNGIKKMYGFVNSYQAVYKAVNELVEKNVLKENKLGYEINISWVKKLQSFTDIVETNYYANERLNNLGGLNESKRGEDMMILSFKSLFDAEKYLYYFIKTELLKKKNQVVCYSSNYEWKPLFYLRAEYNYFTKLSKRGHKFYFISSGDSEIEKFSRKFYATLGIRVKKTKSFITNNTIAFSDFFIQIFIPKNVNEKIGKFLKEDNVNKLIKVLDAGGPIKIIVHKDKDLAGEMKKQILQEF